MKIAISARELREKGRKKCWSPSQKFWMECSLYLTTPLVNTRVTPNMITLSWIVLEIFAAGLLIAGNYLVNVIAVVLFNFLVLLGDHMDGNLARMKEKFSMLGSYFEQVGLFFGTPLFFLGLAIGNYMQFQHTLFFVLSMGGVFFWLYEKLIRINPAWFGENQALQIRQVYSKASFRSSRPFSVVVELFRRGQPFNLLFFLILFDYPQAAALIYSAFFALEFLRKFTVTIIALRRGVRNA